MPTTTAPPRTRSNATRGGRTSTGTASSRTAGRTAASSRSAGRTGSTSSRSTSSRSTSSRSSGRTAASSRSTSSRSAGRAAASSRATTSRSRQVPGAGARGTDGAGRSRVAGPRAGRRHSPTRRGSVSTRAARRDAAALRLRLGIPYLGVVLLALGLAARLIWVGVVESDTYAELGLDKRLREITLHEQRGTIFDRNGEALVMSVPTKQVAVDPTLVDDPEALATQLAGILGIDRLVALAAVERPDTRYAVVARQVDAEVADRLAAERIPGITFSEDPTRLAVNGDLARSVTGSMDRYATTARSGIELLYDEQLRATEGLERVEQGIRGSTIPGSEQVVRPARAGSDVTLTLDRAMQFLAEAELAKQVNAVSAKGGTVVLGRPQTGEILAMASVARTPEGQVVQGSLNQAIRLYEPGSVMKLVTVGAAYDMGLVRPESTLVVPDEITLFDKTIHDSHDHAPESMTVNRILSESSNVGTIKIAQMIEAEGGIDKMVDYLHSFGFGKYTALGLPKEQAGDVKDPEDWNGTDIGSVPIGQSVTVSPVQMWSAYNTVANDGTYVAPRLVRDVVDAEGRHHAPRIPEPHRVISTAAADMLTQSLEDVVEEGTGKTFAIPGFNIAAKTGTAYKVQDDGTYGTAATRKYMASFVGFFPASNPQISIMVMIDEPGYGLHFGATAAGPVFDALAKESMRRFSIAGDSTATPRTKLIRSQPATAPTTTTTTTTTTIPTTTAPPAPPTGTGPLAGAAPTPNGGGAGAPNTATATLNGKPLAPVDEHVGPPPPRSSGG